MFKLECEIKPDSPVPCHTLLTYSGPAESPSTAENQSGTKHYLALSRPVAALVDAGDLRKKHCSAVGDKITGF